MASESGTKEHHSQKALQELNPSRSMSPASKSGVTKYDYELNSENDQHKLESDLEVTSSVNMPENSTSDAMGHGKELISSEISQRLGSRTIVTASSVPNDADIQLEETSTALQLLRNDFSYSREQLEEMPKDELINTIPVLEKQRDELLVILKNGSTGNLNDPELTSSTSSTHTAGGKIHPQGLRAFPPEVREMIFKAYFVDMEESQEISSSLLHYLNSDDKELHDEALIPYFKATTVTMQGSSAGHWKKSAMSFEDYEFWWTTPKTPYFPQGIPLVLQPLVTKLRVIIEPCKYRCGYDNESDGSSSSCEKCRHEKRWGYYVPPNQSDPKYLCESGRWDLSKVQELTIDFSEIDTDIGDGIYIALRDVTYWWAIRHYINCFRLLKKLLVVVDDKREPFWYDSEAQEFERRDEYKRQQLARGEPQLNYCFFRGQAFLIDALEDQDLEIIQQGLDLYPKLTHVRLVSKAQFSHGGVSFFEHVYGDSPLQPVTWFFEAEKGKTLEWNDEAIPDNLMHVYRW